MKNAIAELRRAWQPKQSISKRSEERLDVQTHSSSLQTSLNFSILLSA